MHDIAINDSGCAVKRGNLNPRDPAVAMRRNHRMSGQYFDTCGGGFTDEGSGWFGA